MKELKANIAEDINRHHALAVESARDAINHAVIAGGLLLEAKDSLPHGQFVGWVEANLNVSVRQAQRYIQAAKRKAKELKALEVKNDMMSYLDSLDHPLFVPEDGFRYACSSNGDGINFIVEPSLNHPGYFFVTRVLSDGYEFECTREPIRANSVESVLKIVGLENPQSAAWSVLKSCGVTVALGSFGTVLPSHRDRG